MDWVSLSLTILASLAFTAFIVYYIREQFKDLKGITAWGATPPLIFDFDDGTTQGWSVSTLYDEQGKKYYYNYSGKNYPTFLMYHDEKNQVNQLPPNKNTVPNEGSLVIMPSKSMQLALNKPPFNFSKNDKWYVEIVSLKLSSLFKNMASFEASLIDQFGPTAVSYIRATLLVRVKLQNGQVVDIPEVGGASTYTNLKPIDWVKVSRNFNIPAGAYVQNLVIKLQGDTMQTFEGWFNVDHVEAK